MNNNTVRQLEILRDRVYIYQILTTKSNIWYSNIKQIINIPIILSSFALSILNSNSVSAEEMKLPNIIINSVIGLMVSLINQFRIVEKQSAFKQLSIKFMNLLHEIEDHLMNDDNITADELRIMIKQYDEIISNMEFQIPDRIAKKIKDNYKGKRHLPVFLINGDEDEPIQRRSGSGFRGSPAISSQPDIIVVDVIGGQGEQL